MQGGINSLATQHSLIRFRLGVLLLRDIAGMNSLSTSRVKIEIVPLQRPIPTVLRRGFTCALHTQVHVYFSIVLQPCFVSDNIWYSYLDTVKII